MEETSVKPVICSCAKWSTLSPAIYELYSINGSINSQWFFSRPSYLFIYKTVFLRVVTIW